jgi:hypothetical protein
LAVAAEADTAMELAASQVQTATAAKKVALQALKALGLKPREDKPPVDDETGEDQPPAAATAKEQTAARAAALQKYKKATADAKMAQTALITAQAACTTNRKDVALAKTKIKAAGRVKANADRAHKTLVVHRDLLVKAVGVTQSRLTAAGKHQAGKPAMDKLTTAVLTVVADHQAYQNKVTSSDRSKSVAAASLTRLKKALVPFSEAAAEATRAEKLARTQLETAMTVHDVSREAIQALGKKGRPTTPLPTQTQCDPIQPATFQHSLSPTPKVRYVTKPKMERNHNEWYQMIGTDEEATCFYESTQANKVALPVGAVIQNAIKYYRFNHPYTTQQALAWAQLDDLSTGYNVDLNSYNPTTHMLDIDLILLKPAELPEDTFEWPNRLATTTIDLNETNYRKHWLLYTEGIPVTLKTILKTCDANMHTVITDALHGTMVVNVPAIGIHPDSAMVASWVGKTTTETNFLSPGAETKGKLQPQEDYGVDERDRGEEGGYAYRFGGETRYIKSYGSMKGYNNANTDHQKRVKQMGFEKEYFIPKDCKIPMGAFPKR